MSVENSTFFDKYGKYMMGALLLYFAYGFYLTEIRTDPEVREKRLNELRNLEYSPSIDYGWELGETMYYEEGENNCFYYYSGDVETGCNGGYEFASGHDSK